MNRKHKKLRKNKKKQALNVELETNIEATEILTHMKCKRGAQNVIWKDQVETETQIHSVNENILKWMS